MGVVVAGVSRQISKHTMHFIAFYPHSTKNKQFYTFDEEIDIKRKQAT